MKDASLAETQPIRLMVDKAAHKRIDTLHEEIFGEPNEDGLKTRVSNLDKRVAGLDAFVRGRFGWILFLLAVIAGASVTSCMIYMSKVVQAAHAAGAG